MQVLAGQRAEHLEEASISVMERARQSAAVPKAVEREVEGQR